MNSLLLTRCLVLLATGMLSARAATPSPVVLELFTSQGCSSCPPADALLGEWAQQPNVIALAFHVDYWDDLGWRDQFALPLSTQRQQQYGDSLKLRSAFTPQLIVDGLRSVVGSNRHHVNAAIKPQQATLPVKLSIAASELVIALDARTDANRLDVNVVSYRAQAATHIGRGENAGHVLKEYNIVRSLRRMDSWDGQARRWSLPLDSLPKDADHVAVLLQQPGQGQIAGAASIAIR